MSGLLARKISAGKSTSKLKKKLYFENSAISIEWITEVHFYNRYSFLSILTKNWIPRPYLFNLNSIFIYFDNLLLNLSLVFCGQIQERTGYRAPL